MRQRRFGALDQKPPVQIFWLMLPRPCNTWMKSRTPWKLPSNGPLKKLLWLRRTWEVLDSIFMMLPCTLMPSTEVVVKSFPLLEESTMLRNWLLDQDSKNPSSSAKFKHLMMLWEVSINAWPKEEVLSLVRSQFLVPHSSLLRPTYPSLSHSVSPNTWEPWPLEELSHNVYLIIGRP